MGKGKVVLATGQNIRIRKKISYKQYVILNGKIISSNDYFFTIQTEHYKEDINYSDLEDGYAVILI